MERGCCLHSFCLIEAPVYVSGKNTTDIALVMDMMEIFYTEESKVFCIVSCDSDYTIPAQRLKEKGVIVLGWGKSEAAVGRLSNCQIFPNKG